MRTQPRAVTVFREALALFTLAAVLFAGGCTTYSNSDNSNPVNSAPAVTTNPANQTVTAGQMAIFTAAASGNPAPTVQWQVSTNGGTSFNDMAGASSMTLALTTALPMNGNQYHAVFTNGSGNITTTAATLTVNVAPSITLQPSNQTVNAGQTATFTATASGTPAPTVQWQVSTNGGTSFSDVAGASSTTLSLANTMASMNGNQYHAVFTNASGNVTTAAATLTVNFAPTITLQPSSQTVTAGQAASFTATANGNPAPTVQWQMSTNGGASFSDIAGANSMTLTLPIATLPMTGNQYHAVFTNPSGNITTSAATLTVNVAPLITLQPSNQTVNAGQAATFTAAASGTPAPTVQWQVSTNGGASFSDMPGASSTTLSLTNTMASMNGNQYHAVFTNASGSVTTTAATLTVNFPPTITLQPSSQTVTEGQTATFTAAANGSPAPTVQWQVSTNGGTSFSDVPGASSTTLSLTSTTASMNGNQYHAVFTSASGTITTTAATLTVNVLPLITLQPSNQTVNAGQTVTFTAAASGTPAPTVQWQVSTNGGASFSDLAGASSTTLSIANTTASMNGNQYHAVFANASGSVTTTAATLTVNFPPTITLQPSSQTVTEGQAASFTATANGSPAPTVQWQVSTNGGTSFSDVAGAGSTTLTLTSTTASMNGNQYHAVFTNASGNITTAAATLTVNVAPLITLQPSNQTVNAGQTATFTATATATPAPTVQWQVSTNGGASFSDVAGASSTTLMLTNTTASMNGNQYHAVFTNASGNITTTAASLTVNFPPTITLQPSNQTVTEARAASFTATANGSPVPTVQWQVSTNGGTSFSDVPGASSTTLSLTSTTASMNGNQYHAVFTNVSGNITTTAATLTVNVAPLITLQPSNQTVTAGQTATFTATATATPSPTVQWQVSTNAGASFSDLAGASSTTLSIANTTTSMNGNQYHAVFTNASGNVTTTAATLTVNFPPTITLQPSSQTITEGQAASFTATANGSPAPTVQWQVSINGGTSFNDVPGASSTTLSLTSTTASMNGNQYHAVFTNVSGNITTTAATLTVNVAPLITLQPSNQTVTAGQTATFTAAATATPSPTVQWQVSTNGGTSFSDVAGASSTTLSLTNTTASMNGNQYHAVFTNASGSVTTSAATLTVNFAPTITVQPSSQTVTEGQTATFTAAANGSPAPTVQWQVSTNGGTSFSDVPGASSTTLSLTNATASMSGNQYHAVFTNPSGTITTTAATLTVNFAPTITSQPSNQTVTAGQTAMFTAAASGTPTPTVQWQLSTNGGTSFSDVAGASSTTLSLTNTTASMNGSQYHAVFTNASGNVTTTAATLTVNFPPTITLQPSGQTVTEGQAASFTATASGNPAPTVQWQVSTNAGTSFSDITGASSTTFSLTSTTASMNGNQYHAVFTNASGNITTTAVTLTVNVAPSITLQPSNQTVNAGQTATFTATATGTPAPTVQWQVSTNGGASFTDVAGASSPTLSLASATASMSGNQYHAVFTNVLGNVTTTAATLTVNFAPAITMQPSNQSVAAGQVASFTAAANGSPAPTVQWQVSTNGGTSFSDVAGANTTTLTITSTTASMDGNQYQAVFTNALGNITTTAATLTVTFAPAITLQPSNQTVTAGQTATFTATASGTPAPTVQWQVSANGGAFSDVPGASSATLSLTNTTASMNGNQYHAVFTNASSSVTTTAATLTVNFPPTITQQPTNQTKTVGQTAIFKAVANGNPAPTVQWQVSTNGGTFSDVAGASSTTLTLTNTTASMNGNQYHAVFTNILNSATTATVTLTVNPLRPKIMQDPSSQSVTAGQTATFTAAATGTPSPTVQWQVSTDGGTSFSDIAGATSTTLTLTNTTALMNGNRYWAVFTNTGGSAHTVVATLNVYDTATCAGAPSGHESALSGHWAVMLQGWQGTGPGSPVASVFSFDASGTGSGSFVDVTGGSGITGHIDANFGANGGNSVLSDELLTTGSSYKVGLDPTNNSGYLGCMVLAMKSGGTTTLRFAVSVVAGAAVQGRIMRWTDTTGDGSEIRASGIMLPQDTTAFALSHLSSNYALGADGTDPNGGHFAFAGTIGINGSGTVTSSEFDSNDAGNLQTDLSYISASIATTSTGSTTAQTGRTLFTDTVPTAAGTTTNHSAGYIVNANEFFFVGIDPFTTSAVFSGRGISTAASFSNSSNSSLNGNYVTQIYGATTGNASCNNSGPCAKVGLGVLQFSGTGALNSASTLYNYQQGLGMQLHNPSGVYAVSPSGRVTITGSEALPVLYLAAPQANTEPITAFSVATDSGVHSSASFGIIEVGANSNVNTSALAGNRIFGSTDPGDSTVQSQAGVVNVDNSGNITGYRYSSDTNGLTESALSDGVGGALPVTITNSPLPGFGDVGTSTVTVTNGSTFWFFDTGSTINPASINISTP